MDWETAEEKLTAKGEKIASVQPKWNIVKGERTEIFVMGLLIKNSCGFP